MLIERKNEPAQVMMQIWPSTQKPYLYQNGVGFKAGPSHLHGSEVLLHLLRDSSHEGKLQGAAEFHFFSNLEERTGESEAVKRGSRSSDWYKTLAGPNWSHRV